MLRLFPCIVLVSVMFLLSCSTSIDPTNDLIETKNNDSLRIENPTWRTDSSSSYFKIDLPIRMKAAPELNEGAEIAYSFTQKSEEEVKEFYMLVVVETYEQIKTYGFSKDFNLSAYNNAVLSNVTENLDHFELLESDDKVTHVNKLECIVNAIFGSLGEVNIFYKLAVYKGSLAYYQVLTWTLDYQRSEFEEDMDRMINSFVESIKN